MRLDQVAISIEPRSVGGAIDLAVCFFREELRGVLGLTLVFAVPLAALGTTIAALTDAGLPCAALLFVMGSPFLGSALVAGAGPRVFGDPFTVRGALSRVRARLPLLLAQLFAARLWLGASLSVLLWTRDALLLIAALTLLPLAALATMRHAYLPELVLLEELRGTRLWRRAAELRSEGFLAFLARLCAILVFCAAAVISLFVLVDQASDHLFGLPILWGRVSAGFLVTEAWGLIARDAIVLGTLQAVVWLVYPLGRLAWFFSYLDARIRRECWDLELDFRLEARRVEGDKA